MSRSPAPPTQSLASKIAWNALANYAGVGIALAVSFFLLPYILRRLGDEQYGLWIVVASLGGYFALFEFGVGGSVVKAVAECRARGQQEELNRVVGAAFAMFAVSGGAVVLATGAAALWIDRLFEVAPGQLGQLRALILVVGLHAALALPLSLFERVLAGFQRFDLVNLAKAASVLTGAALTVAALEAGFGVVGLALAYAAGAVVAYLIQVVCVRRVDPAFRLDPRGASRTEVLNIANVSAFLFLIGLAWQAIRTTDQLIVGALLGLAAVAPYAVARKLRDLILTLIGPLGTVFFPLGAGLAAGPRSSRAFEVAAGGTKICLAITSLLAVVLGVHAEPLLAAWVGPEYVATAGPPLLILLAGTLATGAAWVVQEMLHAGGGHRIGALLLAVEAIGGAALGIALLPRFGLRGVAVGVAIFATVVSTAAVVYYVRSFLGADFLSFARRSLLPPLGVGLLTLLAALLAERLFPSTGVLSLAVHMLGTAALFALLYLGLATSRDERAAMRRVARSLPGRGETPEVPLGAGARGDRDPC